jgi:hypothetical protein
MRLDQVVSWTVFSCVALTLGPAPARAQTCRWDGTAPYCAGECGIGETEEGRASAAHMVTSLPSVNHFGNGCVFGTKAYCCETPGITCRWDGTAPFCEGECEADENETKRCESCSGKVCWTGSKAKCCKGTGSTGQPLQASPELTQYAAIWEKKSGPAWVARHGLTSAQYQQEFDRLSKKGFRIVGVSGYGVAGKAHYAAIWEAGPGPARVARHGMTSAKYQQAFTLLTGQGYRLVRVSGYGIGGTDYYAAIFEKRTGPPWVARHGMTSAQYQKEFEERAGQGYRLIDVSGYSVAGKDRYAAIWEKRSGPAWVGRHGMTSAQYQEVFNDLGQKGYRLVHVSGYGIGGKNHYAAIWEQASGPSWVARHGMTADGYQEEFNHLAQEGYRLLQVSGFHPYY